MVFVSGFKLTLGLIVAIGAQNAFVLRQGLRREHVLPVALFCAASDAALIALGVSGFAVATRAAPWLAEALRWGGVAFLLWYGARAALAAWRGGEALEATNGGKQSLRSVMLTLAVITYFAMLFGVYIFGEFINARAIATRWASPPESSDGL